MHPIVKKCRRICLSHKKGCCDTGQPADTTASETSVLIGLFKCNLSSLSLKFSFDILRLSFGCALFNNLRSTINDSFSLFKSKTCDFTNNLDNFNFRCASRYKFYVELFFFFCCCSTVCSCCYLCSCVCVTIRLCFANVGIATIITITPSRISTTKSDLFLFLLHFPKILFKNILSLLLIFYAFHLLDNLMQLLPCLFFFHSSHKDQKRVLQCFF